MTRAEDNIQGYVVVVDPEGKGYQPITTGDLSVTKWRVPSTNRRLKKGDMHSNRCGQLGHIHDNLQDDSPVTLGPVKLPSETNEC